MILWTYVSGNYAASEEVNLYSCAASRHMVIFCPRGDLGQVINSTGSVVAIRAGEADHFSP